MGGSSFAPSGGFKAKSVTVVSSGGKPASKPAISPMISTPIIRRPDFQTFYDPSRIIDKDKLKIVDDMRTEGSERGETQTGDDGMLGPGSDEGAFAEESGNGSGITSRPLPEIKTHEGKKELTGGQIALIAAISFILFGA